VLSLRWIVNATLIVLIAVLTYIGLGFDEESDDVRGPGISELSPADITRVGIQTGDVQLELRRDADGWHIESPVDWPAYDANVERLLSIVDVNASPLGDPAELNLDALGLETPSASLRFNDTLLLFGAINNIGERRYLLIDSTLYLIPDFHLAFVAQGLPGMVDRRMLPKRNPIASLQLPEFELTRDSDDRWRSSHTPEFTQAQLRQLIDNWHGLQASRVKRFDSAANAMQTIEARLADGRVIDFLLLSVAPEIIIANPQIGLQYHFRGDYHDRLITIADTADDG
jgi:hypothetical protein